MSSNKPMRLILAGMALALAGSAQAGDIYQWTDEQGRTHLSDTVPKRYRESATRQDSRRYEPTQGQRKEAAAPAASAPAVRRAAAQGADRGASEGTTAPAPQPAASAAPVTKLPADEDACAKAWREYREKESCFAPFRTATHGIKAEAFAICGPDMVSPAARCGPPD